MSRYLSVIDIVIFTRAFFFRFPDRLIKLFEVKCSFLDKLTTFTDMLILLILASVGKYAVLTFISRSFVLFIIWKRCVLSDLHKFDIEMIAWIWPIQRYRFRQLKMWRSHVMKKCVNDLTSQTWSLKSVDMLPVPVLLLAVNFIFSREHTSVFEVLTQSLQVFISSAILVRSIRQWNQKEFKILEIPVL